MELTRRPNQRATAEKMNMEVGNGFATIRTAVDDDLESGIRYAGGTGHFSDGKKQSAQSRLIL